MHLKIFLRPDGGYEDLLRPKSGYVKMKIVAVSVKI
jgi:hypothetical protein